MWLRLGAVGWANLTSLAPKRYSCDRWLSSLTCDRIAPVVLSLALSSRRSFEGVGLRAAARLGASTDSCGDEEPVSSVIYRWSSTSRGIVPPALLAALLLVVVAL